MAHNYYPTHLWRDREKDLLEGNAYFDSHQGLDAPPDDPTAYDRCRGVTYAPDAMVEEALRFVRDHADQPFFLYYPTVVPHAALQVPEESLAEYSGKLDDGPYLGQKGYLPHPEPRAAYAAMVTRMDRDLGRIVALIDELETEMYEGGIRVPLIARGPGHIAAGQMSDVVSPQWDPLPTILELAGAPAAETTDGISLAPTLLGQGMQPGPAALYWELGRQQAIRSGDWKLVRRADADGNVVMTELFDLAADPGESTDVAPQHPDVVARLLEVAAAQRRPSTVFPSPFDR